MIGVQDKSFCTPYLKHLAKHFGSQLGEWIGQKIVGLSGYKTDFWMNHEAHKSAMQGLFDDIDTRKINTDSGLTAQNMVANYLVASTRLDGELNDLHRFESFVFYFMHRLVIITLSVLFNPQFKFTLMQVCLFYLYFW